MFMRRRKLSKLWNILFPFHEGQRVRIIKVTKEKRCILITQGGCNLDFRGERGRIVDQRVSKSGKDNRYLVELEDRTFKLYPNEPEPNDHTRLWCRTEELEVVSEEE